MAADESAARPDLLAIRRSLGHDVDRHAFSHLAPDLQKTILTGAKSLLPAITAWATRYPIVSAKRLMPACVAAAVTFPDGAATLQHLLAQFYLALWAMDDVVDGIVAGDYGPAQTTALLQLLIAITAHPGRGFRAFPEHLAPLAPLDDRAPWAQAVSLQAEFCTALQAWPGFTEHYTAFAARFAGMIRSWEVEIAWKARLQAASWLPSYAAYLENGRESIIHAAILLAFLVMVPPAGSDASEISPAVEPVLVAASTGVRLANDVRSYARDLAEQKPTALQILMHERGLDESAAEKVLLEAIATYEADLERALAALPAALVPWGEAVRRVTLFGIGVYLGQEFHQLSTDDLAR